MWNVVHWFFLYYLQPKNVFHPSVSIIVAISALLGVGRGFSSKDIVPGIGLMGMYLCVVLEPLHAIPALAYHPFWIVSIMGLRRRELFLFIGTIVTGFYLFTLPSLRCVAVHVFMNAAFSLTYRKHRLSFKGFGAVHFCVSILALGIHPTTFFESNSPLKDIIFIFSSLLYTYFDQFSRPDWISIIMMFTTPFTCAAWILHAMEPHWYQFIKNNHFRKVKNTYSFICAVLIVVFAIFSNTDLIVKM